MVMRRAGRRGFIARPRPRFQWVRVRISADNSAGFTHDIMNTLRAQMGLLTNPAPLTVYRMVGTHVVRAVTVDDAFTTWIWGFAHAATDLPPGVGDNPLGSPNIDWMYTREQAIVQSHDSGTPVVKYLGVGALVEFDIASRRRLDDLNDSIWYVSNNPDGDNFDVRLYVNMLVRRY